MASGDLWAIVNRQYDGDLLLPSSADGVWHADDAMPLVHVDSDIVDLAAPGVAVGTVVIKSDGTVWGGGYGGDIYYNHARYYMHAPVRYYSQIADVGSGWTGFSRPSFTTYGSSPVFAKKGAELYYWGEEQSTYLTGWASVLPVLLPYSASAEVSVHEYGAVIVRDGGTTHVWPDTAPIPAAFEQLTIYRYGYIAWRTSAGDVYMDYLHEPFAQPVLVAQNVRFLAERVDITNDIVVVKNDGRIFQCDNADYLAYLADPVGDTEFWYEVGDGTYNYVAAYESYWATGVMLAQTDSNELHVYRWGGIGPLNTYSFSSPIKRVTFQWGGFNILEGTFDESTTPVISLFWNKFVNSHEITFR